MRHDGNPMQVLFTIESPHSNCDRVFRVEQMLAAFPAVPMAVGRLSARSGLYPSEGEMIGTEPLMLATHGP